MKHLPSIDRPTMRHNICPALSWRVELNSLQEPCKICLNYYLPHRRWREGPLHAETNGEVRFNLDATQFTSQSLTATSCTQLTTACLVPFAIATALEKVTYTQFSCLQPLWHLHSHVINVWGFGKYKRVFTVVAVPWDQVINICHLPIHLPTSKVDGRSQIYLTTTWFF